MGCNARIKSVRNSLNLSQAAFGQRLGASRDAINNAENGRADVSDMLLLSICREFNVNEQWLRTGEGEMLRKREHLDELQELVGRFFADETQEFRLNFVRMAITWTDAEWDAAENKARSLLGLPPKT